MNLACMLAATHWFIAINSQGRGRRPSLVSSLPRASFGFDMRFGVLPCTACPPWRTPLLSFGSLQRSLVTPRCSRLHDTSRSASTFTNAFASARPCGFSLSENESESISNHSQPGRACDDVIPIQFHRPPRVMHRRFHPDDVPLPARRALVTWPIRIAKRRSRLLIFRWGKRLSATLFCNRANRSQHADVSAWSKRTSRSLGAEDIASAHHQSRLRGRRFNRRHSWASRPSQVCSRCGWRDVSAVPGLHAVRRSARRD